MQAYRKRTPVPDVPQDNPWSLTYRKRTLVPELAEGATPALHPCLLLFYCPQAHPLRWVGLPFLPRIIQNKRPMEHSPWALKSSSKILTIVSFQHQRINIRCSIRKTGSDQTVANASGSERRVLIPCFSLFVRGFCFCLFFLPLNSVLIRG